jgi:hypothetical protein
MKQTMAEADITVVQGNAQHSTRQDTAEKHSTTQQNTPRSHC